MNDSLVGRAAAAPIGSGTRSGATSAALLIDFDNVTMGIRSDLQPQLRRLLNSEMIKGKVAVQRAYADWRRYPQYIVPLSESSIDLIFAPAFGSNKKNATDIRLAIDALELVFTRPEIGTFILLSGDSDFSSLVLKLKEYGKWVIGVGIRESASDLLVQNCDEYFSYAELTGLTREGEIEVLRRDPWELVVEAALRMEETNDVMRSDRLKQVMQQIDPHYDEKDAGFNRFSKFVAEAERRGLLDLTKMDSGQYAIRLGPDANIPPEAVPVDDEEDATAAGQRKRGGRSRGVKAAGGHGLTLASAFALLKRALVDLGATDSESTDADQVRERMIELGEGPDDPVFEAKRFQRLLRQAHDASLIELVKDDDVYLLKLHPEAPADEESKRDEEEAAPKRKRASRTSAAPAKRRSRVAKKDEPAAASSTDPELTGAPEVGARPARQAKPSLRGRGSSRTRKTKVKPEGIAGGAVPVDDAEQLPPSKVDRPAAEAATGSARRSVRGRGSSRGRRVASPPAKDAADRGTSREPEVATAAAEEKPTRRSGRPAARPTRTGRSSTGDGAATVRKPRSKRESAKPGAAGRKPTTGSRSTPRRAASEDHGAAPEISKRTRAAASQRSQSARKRKPAAARDAEEGSDDDTPPVEQGIFKRVTAALQRAVRGEAQDEQ